MKKFLIKETQAVWVTWNYVIEAESEQEAREKYTAEQPVSLSLPEIGENIDGYDQIIAVEPY